LGRARDSVCHGPYQAQGGCLHGLLRRKHHHRNEAFLVAARPLGVYSPSMPYAVTHAIVLPGGGYAEHAAHEGEPVVKWLKGLGLEAGVFRYPLRVRHPVPLHALQAEIRRLRQDGVTRVGLVGFSAGGHLAGMAALASDAGPYERVDFAVLGYAITSMETETYRPARLILLGEDASLELRRATSLDAMVTQSSPPFFIWHTAEDAYVPPEHTYRLARVLAAQRIPHTVHVFAHGPHSLGLAQGSGDPETWTALAASWIAEQSNQR
jgi:acetyl esterase/lipase